MKVEKISLQDVAVRWITNQSESDFNYLYSYLNPRFKSFLWKSYFSHSYNRSIDEIQKDIDDIINNAWIRVFKSAHKYKQEFKFTTWIFTITRNEARNFFKEKNRYLISSNTNDEFVETLMFSKGMFDIHYDHNGEMELDSLYRDVMSDILTSPKNTEILIDREVNKMSYSEISTKHNINESTSKVLVHRNRKTLKKKYEDRYSKIIDNKL